MAKNKLIYVYEKRISVHRQAYSWRHWRYSIQYPSGIQHIFDATHLFTKLLRFFVVGGACFGVACELHPTLAKLPTLGGARANLSVAMLAVVIVTLLVLTANFICY